MRVVDVPLYNGALHSLYLKEHNTAASSSGSGGIKAGRTLFVGNIDLGLQMSYEEISAYLKELFNNFGQVENILVSKFSNNSSAGGRKGEETEPSGQKAVLLRSNNNANSNSSRFAHVVFENKKSIRSILAAPESTYYDLGKIICDEYGLRNRCNLPQNKKRKSFDEIKSMFSYLSSTAAKNDKLMEENDEFMREFEENEILAKAERERLSRQPDEDGFMPVQHRKKRKRVAEKRSSGSQRSRGAKKDTELKNFYSFQIKQDKISRLEELRSKFEEDKIKVAALKQQRNFKPF